MLKAEDTVMSWEGIRIVFQEQDKKGTTDNMFIMEALCLAQAKISFKAGYEAGVKKASYILPSKFKEVKQRGIKEVVDWVLAHSQLERCDPDVMTYFIDYLAVDYPDWQAKQKEWGVE